MLFIVFIVLLFVVRGANLCDPNKSTMIALSTDDTRTECERACSDSEKCMSYQHFGTTCSLWSTCVTVEWDDDPPYDTYVAHKRH
jgi:hypothetical protein